LYKPWMIDDDDDDDDCGAICAMNGRDTEVLRET
jgi:hypothetical protein